MNDAALIDTNLWDLRPDTPIYRTAKLDFVISDIQANVLTMPRVVGWEDTHEAAFFTRKVPTAHGELVDLGNLAVTWFGQCWTTQSESDAMWRIYNHDFDSIRIETTAGALLRTIFLRAIAKRPAYEKWAINSLFIGEVQYLNSDEFKELMKTPAQSVLTSSSSEIARMLMKKRFPFDHEREVRLLYHQLEGGDYEKDGLDDSLLQLPSTQDYKIGDSVRTMKKLIQLPFDWRSITGAMIGPRTEDSKASEMGAILQSTAPWMRLSRSDLYGRPSYDGQF